MKRTGKMLLSILALALVFTAFCCCASANYGGTCGDNVDWSLNTATGELTLSGTGPTWDYTYDPDRGEVSPFDGDENIRSVVVTDGITRIGTWLFDECHNMQSVSLPGSLQCIGTFAFNSCSKLSVLRIPKDVNTIESCAFYGCSDLEDVVILSRNAGFGKDVFRSCSDSLTLHGYAGSTAQSYATANGISFEVFSTSGKWDALSWNLASGVLTISGNSSMADAVNGSDFHPWRAHADTVEAVNIEFGVRSISAHCFEDFSQLKTVTIPNSVGVIGKDAFKGCSISSVDYGGTSRQWNDVSVKEGNDALKSAEFHYASGPSGIWGYSLIWKLDAAGCLTLSGGYMSSFSNRDDNSAWREYKDSIRKIVIGPGLSSIGMYAFDGCVNLESVTIPVSVTRIYDYAFYNCTALRDVYYGGTEAQWNSIDFTRDNYKLKSATIHCNSVYDLVLPAALTTIEADAFLGIRAASVLIPKTVKTIKGNPFAGSQVTTIYGYPDTPAQNFAKQYGYTFVSVG